MVERGLADSVTAFLAEHDLTIDDIASWICHPGGPKVIDAVQRALKLPDRRGGGKPPVPRRGRQHVLGVGAAHPGDDQRRRARRPPGLPAS